MPVWPDMRRVRLTGFAREMQAFASDDAYYAARGTPDAEQPQARRARFHSGRLICRRAEAGKMFPRTVPSRSRRRQPPLLTGKVLEHRTLHQRSLRQRFVWLLVESLEATFDIVADPAMITGDIVDGGTIEAAVWMFGRILEDDDTRGLRRWRRLGRRQASPLTEPRAVHFGVEPSGPGAASSVRAAK